MSIDFKPREASGLPTAVRSPLVTPRRFYSLLLLAVSLSRLIARLPDALDVFVAAAAPKSNRNKRMEQDCSTRGVILALFRCGDISHGR